MTFLPHGSLGNPVLLRRVSHFCPEGARFSKPRATPWGTMSQYKRGSAQRANGSPFNPRRRPRKSSTSGIGWPVGPRNARRGSTAQGDALGWENLGPSAQQQSVFHGTKLTYCRPTPVHAFEYLVQATAIVPASIALISRQRLSWTRPWLNPHCDHWKPPGGNLIYSFPDGIGNRRRIIPTWIFESEPDFDLRISDFALACP